MPGDLTTYLALSLLVYSCVGNVRQNEGDRLGKGVSDLPFRGDANVSDNLENIAPLTKKKTPLPKECSYNSAKKSVKCGHCISYIPELPKGTRLLGMNNSCLGSVNKGSFANITNVSLLNLDLWNSGITDLSADAFSTVKFQQHGLLDLGWNNISSIQIGKAICSLNAKAVANIATLSLNNVSLGNIPENFFSCLSKSSISYLNLQANFLTEFSGKLVSPLRKFAHLNLNHNSLSRLEHPELLRFLRILELRWNQFSAIPRFQGNERKITEFKLQSLRLGSNPIRSVHPSDFKGFQHLERLELTFSYLSSIPDNAFLELRRLAKLYLQGVPLRKISRYAFNRSSLEYLDMSSTGFQFPHDGFVNFFDLCPNLKTLYLQGSHMSWEILGLLLRPLKKLQVLNMVDVGITNLPTNFSKTLPALEKLQLSGNNIRSWDPKTFYYANKLENLQVDSNKITILNKTSLPLDRMKNLNSLNLAGNPFDCTCDLLWFRTWINKTKIKITAIHHPFSYTCSTPPEWHRKPLLDFHPTFEWCNRKDYTLYIVVGSTLGGVALVAAIMSVVCLKYKEHIRYFWFLVHARLKHYTEIEDGDAYVYDAFVVYSSNDRNWVIEHLLHRVEYEEEFKLCFYDRDFIPGQDIVDNIIEHMEESRKVILVLSDSFAASEWCKWEMAMAQHKLLDAKKDILILVKLDDIKSENMNNRLMLLMRDKVYIDWSDTDLGRDLFWKKLLTALARPAVAVNA